MPSTAEASRSLLEMLSDDELARYGEIARDQAVAELNRWWLQAGLALAAVGTLIWAVVKWGLAEVEALGVEAAGFGFGVSVALGTALALAYSPYRRVKNWTLWNRHCKAVLAEQERRISAAERG